VKIRWKLIDDGRLMRSKEVNLSSIDYNNKTAVFTGSNGSQHKATLESCDCMDYQRHQYQPCKHMIRLANELGVLNELSDEQEEVTLLNYDLHADREEEIRPGKSHHAYLSLSDYVVIDLETTDRNVKKAQILEFAAVRVTNGIITDMFVKLANPGVKNTPQAYAVNRISDEMIANAEPLPVVFGEFLDFIGDSPVVGHNISSYDTVLIYDKAMELYQRPFTNRIVDTYWFSHMTHKELSDQTLYTMCKYYNIINENAHRALSDVICTWKLYERIKHYVFDKEIMPAAYTLHGYTPEYIYKAIFDVVDDAPENIVLKLNKTAASIYMYGAVAFVIRINSRSQYIETAAEAAAEFVGRIPGAVATKTGYRFPIASQKTFDDAYKALILAVYEYRKSMVVGVSFGCCNDFLKCSDAMKCIHMGNLQYAGCSYRRNIENGLIFYGKNKNH